MSFDASSVLALVQGSRSHEYTHPKVSKESLSKAVAMLTEGMAQLFETTKLQSKELAEYKERTVTLEEVNASLEERIRNLELSLGNTMTKQLEHQESMVDVQNTAKKLRNLETTVSKIVPELEEHDLNIQRLLRQGDRQQASIQNMKLEVSKAQETAEKAMEVSLQQNDSEDSSDDSSDEEGGSSFSGSTRKPGAQTSKQKKGKKRHGAAFVDTDGVKLTAENVFCQDVDYATGEMSDTLIPLSELLGRFGNRFSEQSKKKSRGDLDQVWQTLDEKAEVEDVAALQKALDTTCTNLSTLFRNFFEAGIFEVPPPDLPICDVIYERKDVAKTPTETTQSRTTPRGVSEKLQSIRASCQSCSLGPLHVTQALRDVRDRLGLEVDTLNEEIHRIHRGMDTMRAELETKLDADGVDSKIEVKFDEVIDQLDKAIATAGADEDEFKKAAKELQEMCSLLMSSKADQSEILDIRKKLELDGKIADQIQRLQEYMEDKLSRTEADELIAGKVAKEELVEKLTMMHRRLRNELELAIDEREGLKPWLITRPLSPCRTEGKHGTPLDALTCIACNRKVTPGQMELLKRAPAVHNNVMNKNRLESGSTKPVQKRIKNGKKGLTHTTVIPFDNDYHQREIGSPSHSRNMIRIPTVPNTSSLPTLHDHQQKIGSLRSLSSPQGKPATQLYGTEKLPSNNNDNQTDQGKAMPVMLSSADAQIEERERSRTVSGLDGEAVIEQVPVKTFSF